MPIRTYAVEALQTNYIWVLRDESEQLTYVIDPGEAAPVSEFLTARGWKLDAILNTHHHRDHVGGNLELKNRYNCPIFAFEPDAHRIDGVTERLSEGSRFRLGHLEIEVIFLPGHTHGQIAYYFAKEGLLFSGDCVFNMGCGRLFEGTAEQMHNSLQKIMNLPPETKIYCGHEYSLSNAAFARIFLSNRPAFEKCVQLYEDLRKRNEPTVPSTVACELETNPFFNCGDSALKARLRMEQSTEAEVFAELRKRKDSFTA